VDTDAEDHCFVRYRYYFMSWPIKPKRLVKRRISNIGRAYREAVKKWEVKGEKEESSIWQDYA